MQREEPDLQADLIKSKHKITLEEIKESVCESNGTNSFDEDGGGLRAVFKTELSKDRTMLVSDDGDWGNLSIDPK